MRLLRAKIYLLLFSFIFFLFFSNDFGLVTIEKIAIIVALGIDRVEEDYEITAQIIVPQAKDEQSKNERAIISAKGKSVGEGIGRIGDVTGWYPKLAFCNLIILGESLKEENILNSIDYFISTYRIQDSSLLAFSNNSAKELLNSASPLDNLSSFALQKIFLGDVNLAGNVFVTNLKSFTTGYYSLSKSSIAPYVLIKDTQTGEIEQKDEEVNSLIEGNSNHTIETSLGEEQFNQEKKVVYDATTSLVFNEGIYKYSLTREQTLVFGLLTKKTREVQTLIDGVVEDGKEKDVYINILKNKNNVSVKVVNERAIVQIDCTLWCKIEDYSTTETLEKLSQKVLLSEPIKERAKAIFSDLTYQLINDSVAFDADIFNIKELFYKKDCKNFQKNKDSILQNAVFNVNFNVKSYGS